MSRIGKRKFEVEGPSLWNVLPEGLRRVRKVKDFGKRLKTSFFQRLSCYNLLLY